MADGAKIAVRRLALFELDKLERDIPGPYTVTYLFKSGQVYEKTWDMSQVYPKPETPLEACDEGSREWYDWQDYLRYEQGILHYQRQWAAYVDYCERVAAYIRDNCLDPDDLKHVYAVEDWERVYQAAVCPQVKMEDLRAAARDHFRSQI